MFSVIRGDPASFTAGLNTSAGQLEILREEMGLNKNILTRYTDWLKGFFSGSQLKSLRYRGESVSEMIRQRLPVSFSLAMMSLIFVIIISVPVSLFTARRKGSYVDHIVNLLTAAGISTPGFFLGLLFIWIFGLGVKLFSPGVYIDYTESIFGFIGCLIFPALAIAIPNAAVLIKFLRSSLIHELHSDYVRTAKSKGASRWYILYHHVFKNAVIPAITVLGMIVAEIFSGSIIIEQVFSIPGIGRLLIAAISSRDYPVIQTLVIYIAFIVVLANTLADIAIIIIDPRIRQTGKHNEI
jgi:ABC-type dipeptide/oligopeptide/nickel transport system permease component